MHISKVFESHKTAFSFEFFPPKTEKGAESLYNTIRELIPLKPSYVSVTYGAGGSTRKLTHDLVMKIQHETDLTVVSHLTCVGSTADELHAILTKYRESGIENIMALRGDPPEGLGKFEPVEGGFSYGGDLVGFIKKHFPDMGVGVAGYVEGHPETPNRMQEIEYLKAKVDAGADYICTQLFFDNRDFYDFCERCQIAGITVPIVAGIMPITSIKAMHRMADLAAGARFPATLLKALSRADSDEGVENVGVHWSTQQVMDLLDNNVRGIHFYTLNKSRATRQIYESLGVTTSDQLE
ncbi:MAG: methylenetetrahydrofolate reductase [NAD(P)H] [Chitinivibrionales bacterium]|nr:methylenetetrahydrofolate reductase [NAD(P)H] [Chitinivibrionales bacterium]MBD3397064.1 methylenetetrahydrofolate reductase [NAD(P)H] [Chitinivibrionales bacterium]